MTTRKAPRAFRLTEGEPVSEVNEQGNLPAITDELRRAVAEYIRSAREHADLMAVAERYGEPIARTDEDVLDLPAIEQLLDPMAGTEQRWPLFQTLMAAGLRQGRIADLDKRLAQERDWLRRLFDETLSWGQKVQPLLDDETVSDLTIVGAMAYADGPEGRIVVEQAYAQADEPLRRAEFLVLATGIAWNRSSPVARLLPREATRTLLVREPHAQPRKPDEPGVLVIFRRRRQDVATFARLVEQGVIEAEGAALLTALLHASCSFLIGGGRRQGKTTLLEGLANTLTEDRHLFLVEDAWHQLNLPSHQLKTALRVSLAQRLGDWHQLAAHYRTLMRLRGDTVILDPGTLLMPDVALELASAGVQTLMTVESERVEQIIACLAREAATVLHSPYKDEDAAHREVGAGFHVIVQLSFSWRLQRHYVREARLIGGISLDGQVIQLPLFEAQPGVEGISWKYHAHLKERVVRWAKHELVTPSPIASRLTSMPDYLWEQWCAAPLERPRVPHIDPASRAHEQLLQKARAAIEAGETDVILHELKGLGQLQGDPRGEALIDEALALPKMQRIYELSLAQFIKAVRSALAASDLALAQEQIEQTSEEVLLRRYCERSPQWQELVAEVHARSTAINACQVGLQEASGHRQRGDSAAALAVLRPISSDNLPLELRRTLLAARRALLTQIITQTQDEPMLQQHYVMELEQVNRLLTPQLPPPASDSSQTAGTRDSSSARGAVQTTEPVAGAAEGTRRGWLDTALAHNRERARLRQKPTETE